MVAEARVAASTRVLPPRVALFYLRARRVAGRAGDAFSRDSALRPASLATLLEVAAGRRRTVELGTGTAWTAVALALADRERAVLSFDPVARPEREAYLALAGAARSRIALRDLPGEAGPALTEGPVDLLFIDSSHEREPTVAEFRAWREGLAPGAVVVFDDYGHPAYPGVAEAVADRGRPGEVRDGLFVWRAGAAA